MDDVSFELMRVTESRRLRFSSAEGGHIYPIITFFSSAVSEAYDVLKSTRLRLDPWNLARTAHMRFGLRIQTAISLE